MGLLPIVAAPFIFMVSQFFFVRLSDPLRVAGRSLLTISTSALRHTQTSVISVVFQLVGPVAQLQRNTKYYSGIRPERMAGDLPHIVRPLRAVSNDRPLH